VLDRIISDVVPRAESVLDSSALPRSMPLSWPPPAPIDRILEEEARRLVEECGLALPGLVPLMVRHTRAFLLQAARHDWPHAAATVSVVGSEISGVVRVDDRSHTPREVHFTADRVDATSAGLRLTDYKTGRPMDGALLANVANGTHLQCMAYALGGGRPDATGRYLYLRPNIDNARRDVVVPADAPDLVAAFRTAVRNVLDVWDTGAFFPRFAEPSGTDFGDCRFCEVREACFRNEIDYRARLLRWVADADQQPRTSAMPAQRALLAAWALRAKADQEHA
jgi:hypothetical protein